MTRAQLAAWFTAHRTEVLAAGGVAVAGAAVYVRHKNAVAASTGDAAGQTSAATTTATGAAGDGTAPYGSASYDDGSSYGPLGSGALTTALTGLTTAVGANTTAVGASTTAVGANTTAVGANTTAIKAAPAAAPRPAPAPAKPKAPTPKPKTTTYKSYTIGSGGTLYGAAQSIFGTRAPSSSDLKKLAAANNIKLTTKNGGLYALVHRGQVIKYPTSAAK